jgi:hypothetical protein
MEADPDLCYDIPGTPGAERPEVRMANTIAWPALVTGVALALAAGTALVTARGFLAPRALDRVSWLPPVVLLACSLLLIAGVLVALWALDLRGTLGR